MTMTALHDPAVPMIDLINELDLILNDYEAIHGAPKEVDATLTDIRYMKDTVNHLENLFGDEKYTLHLPDEAIETLNSIKAPLKHDLRELHKVLQKWPQPPTVWAIVTFGCVHTNEVKHLREQIVEHQLRFATFLSGATFLPEHTLEETCDVFAVEVPAEVPDLKILVEKDQSPKTNGQHPTTNGAELPQIVEIEYEDVSTEWFKIIGLIRALPPTLRLSHLVEKLDQLQSIAADTGLSQALQFSLDIVQVLDLARKLDQRLVCDNHFSKDVKEELHTSIDLEVKMLLHELSLLSSLMEDGPFRNRACSQHKHHEDPARIQLIDHSRYEDLPIHQFLRDHCAIFMMILCLVAGARLTERDPRHQGGTRKDDVFEEATAAVMGRLASHSAAVNSWCELLRHPA